MVRRQTQIPHKTITLIIAGILVLASIGWFAYTQLRPKPAATSPGLSGVNLSPATEQEIQESNQHKDDIIKRDESSNDPSANGSGKRSVTPVIVDAGQYDGKIEVRAYVPNVVEANGTCTLTFTNGSAKVTKTLAAAQDATTTRCTNTSISQSEFSPKGEWSVTVSYSSSAAEGSSQAKTFKVQ